MTGKSFTDAERVTLSKGSDEIDIVRSGLEGTMVDAYREIREAVRANPKIKDLRTAAMAVAINKVAQSYESLGIFP
jgi:glutamate dehydrogenase (NAD(P)+)